LGDDVLASFSGDGDTLDGGEGADTLTLGVVGGGSFPPTNATLLGGDGDDRIIIWGESNASMVDGGAGDDTLDIAASSFDFSSVTNVETIRFVFADMVLNLPDSLVAAGATLVIRYADAGNYGGPQGVTIDASAESDGHLEIHTRASLVSAGLAANIDDVVTGGALADIIYTYVGDDVIEGGLGDDLIDAGAGFDIAIFSGNYADYTITQGNGFITVFGADGTDTLYGVNRLQFDDQSVTVVVPGVTLFGTDDDDTLAGGEGDDIISGGGGNDTLSGGDGDDELTGGDGDDIVDGRS
jgi:Ca2+-binding RTX toxin-like protein